MLRNVFGYAAVVTLVTSGAKVLTLGVGLLGASFKTKEQFGNYGTYVLIYSIVQNLFIAGVNQVVQKYGADSEVNRIRFARLAYMLFGVLMIPCGLGFLLIGGVFGKWTIALAFLGTPFIVAWWWARYLFRTTFNAKGESLITVLASLCNSLFILGFIALTDFGDALIYGDFAALVVPGLVSLLVIPRAADTSIGAIIKAKVPREWLWEMYVFGRPIWAAGQLFAAGGWLQGLMTRGKLGPIAMGEWQFMGSLGQLINQPMDIVGHASLPGLVKEKENRPAMYRELLRMCLLAFPFIALTVAAALPLFLQLADIGISYIPDKTGELSTKYGNVHLLLLITAISTPALAIEIVAGQYAISEGLSKAPLQVQAASLVAVLLVLWPAATYFGLYGILIAAAVGEVAKSGAYIYILWRPFPQNMKTSLVYGILSLFWTCMGAVPVYWFRDWEYNWLLALPAAGIFFCGMVLSRLVHREDFRRVYRAFVSREGSSHDEGFEFAPEGFEETLTELQVGKVQDALKGRKKG